MAKRTSSSVSGLNPFKWVRICLFIQLLNANRAFSPRAGIDFTLIRLPRYRKIERDPTNNSVLVCRHLPSSEHCRLEKGDLPLKANHCCPYLGVIKFALAECAKYPHVPLNTPLDRLPTRFYHLMGMDYCQKVEKKIHSCKSIHVNLFLALCTSNTKRSNFLENCLLSNKSRLLLLPLSVSRVTINFHSPLEIRFIHLHVL